MEGRKEHYIMIKGPIHQENIRIQNVCLPNKSVQKCIKENNRTERNNGQAYQYPCRL